MWFINRFSLTLFNQTLAVPLEALITLLFGAVLLSLGIVGFRRSD